MPQHSRRRRRSLRALSCLVVLVALAALAPSSGHAGRGSKGPVPKFQSVAFQQVDWLETTGAPLRSNSAWGVLSFSYLPAPKTWYLNANVKLPGAPGESWFLRNLPLFGERNPRLRREAVFLDLRRLGVADGTDLKEIQALFSLGTSPGRKAPPAAAGSLLPVGSRGMTVGNTPGLSVVEPFDPGAPRPILISRIPRHEFNLRVSRPVQEERGHGVAGGFARSLDWLNQTFQWDPTLSAQKIYKDLLELGVSTGQDENGNGSRYDEWIKAKDAYTFLLSGGEIETSVWDGANIFPPIPGIQEENEKDFMSWFKETPDDADIELVIQLSSGTYVVMLTETFLEGGKTYVRFRVDDKQGDPAGDEEDKVAEIFEGEDGSWYFVSERWKIVGAFAEAVKR